MLISNYQKEDKRIILLSGCLPARINKAAVIISSGKHRKYELEKLPVYPINNPVTKAKTR